MFIGFRFSFPRQFFVSGHMRQTKQTSVFDCMLITLKTDWFTD